MYCCTKQEEQVFDGINGHLKIWITGTEINQPLQTNDPNFEATYQGRSAKSPYIDTNPQDGILNDEEAEC